MTELKQEAAEVAAEAVEVAEDAVAVVSDATTLAIKSAYTLGYQLGRRPGTVALVALSTGVITGGVVGYQIAKRRLSARFSEYYADQADSEIAKMKDHYEAKVVALDSQHKPNLVVEMREEASDQGYRSGDPVGPGVLIPKGTPGSIKPKPVNYATPVTPGDRPSPEPAAPTYEGSEPPVVTGPTSVFAGSAPEPEDQWDYQREIAGRGSDVPFVIHLDEYRENTPGHDQTTLTYFAGDDVLSEPTSGDKIIDDQDATVGVQNLGLFGHGSLNKHIVYVRNPELEIDYEIVRSEGTFAQEAHGFDPEDGGMMRHDRRQRFDDE